MARLASLDFACGLIIVAASEARPRQIDESKEAADARIGVVPGDRQWMGIAKKAET